MKTTFTIVALFLSVAAAHATTPGKAAATQARLSHMAPGSKTECHAGAGGNIECTTDGIRTDVTACSGDYAFGQVSEKQGVTLESTFSKAASKPTAHLADQQFLCVAASAGKGQLDDRYYVIAFPTDRVPGCKGNDLCQTKPQTWVGPKPQQACQWVGRDGDFTGACAAGWVDRGSIEVFSMGLQ